MRPARNPLTGPRVRALLSSPGRARLRRPDTASFTALRTCRSCVTASTSPSDFARRASMVLPVSINGIACIGLTSCVNRTVPPRPGCRPSITSGKPNRASSIAIRIWQASATSRPPPRQKPWITATLGTRSASSRSITACARPISVSTAATSVAPRNALTSAPAMKPDFLAERMTRPVGRWPSSSDKTLSSSSIRSAESVLALVPSRSNSSHATPSESRVSLKFLYGPSASGFRPSSSTRSPRTFMIWLSMLTPSLSASRRPARRRCIRWRCRAVCPTASWH